MLRIVVALLAFLGVAGAHVAAGGTILYATAATPGRVDGFCVGPKGALAGTPITQVGTSGGSPRRLVVDDVNRVLYVGESDRVEAFRIAANGRLSVLNRTKTETPGMNVADMEFSPNRNVLYVAQNGEGRIAGYPIGPDGFVIDPASSAKAAEFTSCIQGESGATLMAIAVHGGALYLSTQFPGRIAIFTLFQTGDLPQTNPATECVLNVPDKGIRAPATPPNSERRKLGRLRSFVIDGEDLYVERVGTQRIISFQLHDGQFVPALPSGKCAGGTAKGAACTFDTDCTGGGTCSKLVQQKIESKTDPVIWYADLKLFRTTLLGTQFGKGRVDAYLLRSNRHLPHLPKRSTTADVRSSPVRMAISDDGIMYVSGGALDRVEAFHLGTTNGLPAPTPFSMTEEQTGSFPNDVALAPLTDGCP